MVFHLLYITKKFFCLQESTLIPLVPPIPLISEDFSKAYRNKKDVLDEKDLSIAPSIAAPCISMLVQDQSLYHNAQHSGNSSN